MQITKDVSRLKILFCSDLVIVCPAVTFISFKTGF